MTARREVPNINHYVERYAAGVSVQELAKEAGVAAGTMAKRLREQGVEIAPPSTSAANIARRGSRSSIAELERRARGREGRLDRNSRHEVELAALFTERAIEFIPQKAIGPYNVDFALASAPIAVEVRGGGGNPRVVANRMKRIEYLLDRGWTVIEVFMRRMEMTAKVTDYIVAAADELRGQPPARGEHRMVWANGQLYAARTSKVD